MIEFDMEDMTLKEFKCEYCGEDYPANYNEFGDMPYIFICAKCFDKLKYKSK